MYKLIKQLKISHIYYSYMSPAIYEHRDKIKIALDYETCYRNKLNNMYVNIIYNTSTYNAYSKRRIHPRNPPARELKDL